MNGYLDLSFGFVAGFGHLVQKLDTNRGIDCVSALIGLQILLWNIYKACFFIKDYIIINGSAGIIFYCTPVGKLCTFYAKVIYLSDIIL